jgi:hypothetical protein
LEKNLTFLHKKYELRKAPKTSKISIKKLSRKTIKNPIKTKQGRPLNKKTKLNRN